MSISEQSARCVLITGGGGFLGRALVRELRRERPGYTAPSEIRVFDRRESSDEGVRSLVGDVRDPEALAAACAGVDAVFHAASLVDWGRSDDETLHAVNVTGTDNLIRACRDAGVDSLVYTSTMDVIYGESAISDADETTPYPEKFGNTYSRTKALAEQAVIRANGAAHAKAPNTSEDENAGVLRTCAVRPCGMFGEGDPYHVSQFLEMVRSGRLLFRMGDGNAVFQHVYVGNVAHAHLLALQSLRQSEAAAAGQIYFVTDMPALNFFDFMAPLMEGIGHRIPPRSRSLPYPLMYCLGALVEGTANLLRPILGWQPTLTRTSVKIVCEDFSIRSDKAARELGYAPIYSEEESLQRTIEWFRENGPVAPPTAP